MAVPETKVFIAFDLSANSDAYFTLNDSTKGLLNSIYPLAGDILTDVTSFVRTVSVDRGKSRELDEYQVGQASVTLNNHSRIFDPFNTLSPYYGQILPRKELVIETNGIRVFTGTIDDWDLTYDVSGNSLASVTATDGFSSLASTEIASHTTTSQLSSARVTAILDRSEVAWPNALRNIETGNTTLQADTIAANSNTLNYLQTVTATEAGSIFIDKDGLLVFRNRTISPPSSVETIFADDGTGIPYTQIGVVYGSENLYNRVSITRVGGTTQTANQTASQSEFGIFSYSSTNLLFNSDADALTYASYLSGLHDQPELRINSLTIALHDKTPAQVAQIMNLDFTDLIQVVFTPNDLGDPITQFAEVIGVNHSIGVDTHFVDLKIGTYNVFPIVLDNNIYGVLGYSNPKYNDLTVSYDDDFIQYDQTGTFGYVLAY